MKYTKNRHNSTVIPPIMNTNPMGVHIGGSGMSTKQKIKLAKKMGGDYFRPKDVSINSWKVG